MFYDRYTSKSDSVYAIVLQWPDSGTLKLDAPLADPDQTVVTMLGLDMKIKWKVGRNIKGMLIEMPLVSIVKIPSKWAWVFKLVRVE